MTSARLRCGRQFHEAWPLCLRRTARVLPNLDNSQKLSDRPRATYSQRVMLASYPFPQQNYFGGYNTLRTALEFLCQKFTDEHRTDSVAT